jgi:hypothetical protein
MKGLKYAFIMSNVIIEMKYLQSGDRGIRVQRKQFKYHVHHEQSATKIMDTCPNFAHNLLHDRSSTSSKKLTSVTFNYMFSLSSHQTHPHL